MIYLDNKHGNVTICIQYMRPITGRPGQSHRSTARSTDPHPRVGVLQSVDRAVDRPNRLAFVHVRAHRSTGLVDRSLVRSTVWSTAKAWQGIFLDLKTSLFNSN